MITVIHLHRCIFPFAGQRQINSVPLPRAMNKHSSCPKKRTQPHLATHEVPQSQHVTSPPQIHLKHVDPEERQAVRKPIEYHRTELYLVTTVHREAKYTDPYLDCARIKPGAHIQGLFVRTLSRARNPLLYASEAGGLENKTPSLPRVNEKHDADVTSILHHG